MEPTQFAPSERMEPEELHKKAALLMENPLVTEILDALPHIAALLNEERQIVYGNKVLLTGLGPELFEQVVGCRPGEVLGCINASNNTGGCGTNENCKYCGAMSAILKSQKEKQKVSYDCRIISEKDSENQWHDLKVTAAPFRFENYTYTLLSVQDVSDQKRRLALEQIFFHDIINRIGSLNGMFELIQEVQEPERMKSLLESAFQMSQEITEEILAQQQIISAEGENLRLNIRNLSVRYLVSQVAQQMQGHLVARGKIILIDPNHNDYIFETDVDVLKRIVNNMLKNALEATKTNGTVTLGYKTNETGISIFVKNEAVLPDEVKAQVFQRSYSTKGRNRGLGTYSIKLLGEKYLKGKVGFRSEPGQGTTFFINVPFKSKSKTKG
jgi:K+-sensing histidine kinase KdpD